MPLAKTLEGGDDNILPLAEFELAAGKNHEAVTIKAGPRAGMKQRAVDTLITKMHGSGQIEASQIIFVPARYGDEHIVMLRYIPPMIGKEEMLDGAAGDIGRTRSAFLARKPRQIAAAAMQYSMIEAERFIRIFLKKLIQLLSELEHRIEFGVNERRHRRNGGCPRENDLLPASPQKLHGDL